MGERWEIVDKQAWIIGACILMISLTACQKEMPSGDSASYNSFKAYWASPAGRSPWSGTEANAAQYANMSVADGTYARVTADVTNDEPYWRFNFTITQNPADITQVKINIKGYDNAAETGTCYTYNFSNSAWISNGATPASNAWINKTFSGINFNQVINAADQLVVYCEGANYDAADYIYIDYIEVIVDYAVPEDYVIQDVPVNTTFLSTGGMVDLTSTGAHGIVPAYTKMNDDYGAIITFNLTDNISLSNLETKTNRKKSIVHNHHLINEIINVSLLLPTSDDEGYGAFVCPNATDYDEVVINCPNVIVLTENNPSSGGMSLGTTNVDGQDYFVINNITGSGAGFVGALWNGSSIYNYSQGASPFSADGVTKMMIDEVNSSIMYWISPDDDQFTIGSIVNLPAQITGIWNYTSSSGTNSIDGAMDFDIEGDLLVTVAATDSTVAAFRINRNNWTISFLGSWVSTVANNCSAEGAYDVEIENRSGVIIVHVGGRTDDDYNLLDFTNPAAPVCLDSWVSSTPTNCSVNNIYGFATDEENNLTYLLANTGDALGVVNTTDKSNIRCLASYNKSTTPYSTDGGIKVRLSPDKNFLVVGAKDDDAMTKFNVTTKGTLTPIAEYIDTTSPCSIDDNSQMDFVKNGEILIVQPSGRTGAEEGLALFNFSSFTCIGWWNTTSVDNVGATWTNYTWYVLVRDNYLIVSNGWAGAGFTVINGTMNLSDTTEAEEPPTNTCTCPDPAADWYINAPDHCNITSDCNLGTSHDVHIVNGTSTDMTNISATITCDDFYMNSTSYVYIDSDGYIKLVSIA